MLKFLRTALFCFALAAAGTALARAIELPPVLSGFVLHQEPDFLTFDELKSLVGNPKPGGALGRKLKKFWETPVISNEAFYAGAKPKKPFDPKLGRYMRLVSWNIEKSFNIKDAIKAFSSEPQFMPLIDTRRVTPGSKLSKTILRQRGRLDLADVLILQEMDYGVKRSGYVNAAGEMAKALNMNYAFAPEQLEIDPVYLGLEHTHFDDGEIDKKQTANFAADPARYKGAFGVAVLSRYPIKRAECFQLKFQAYDWYEGEKPKTSFVERTRRTSTHLLFKNELTRELKVGGRIYFRVDLHVPGLPNDTLTIINVHLEIKCVPGGREIQMQEILSYIKDIKNPVVVAGDFNAAPEDLSPTSAKRVIVRTAKNPETWASVGTTVLIPGALAVNTTRVTAKYTKNFNDPFAFNLPVLLPNPLKPMFKMIEDYRFSDGTSFDFRGGKDRSINHKKGKLANSNERGTKGFRTTFSVKRPLGFIGKYRLDWFFIRSGRLKNPQDSKASYWLAPHFGETLEEMNSGLKSPISDHHPNVVDLPLEEPKI